MRLDRLVPHAIGRVERQLAQETLARRMQPGELFQLLQVADADARGFVEPRQVWLVPPAHQSELALPLAGTPQGDHQIAERRPVRPGRSRDVERRQNLEIEGRCFETILQAPGMRRTDAGKQLDYPE